MNIFDSYQLIDESIATSSCVRRSYLGPKSLYVSDFPIEIWNRLKEPRRDTSIPDRNPWKYLPLIWFERPNYIQIIWLPPNPHVRPRTKRSWRAPTASWDPKETNLTEGFYFGDFVSASEVLAKAIGILNPVKSARRKRSIREVRAPGSREVWEKSRNGRRRKVEK